MGVVLREVRPPGAGGLPVVRCRRAGGSSGRRGGRAGPPRTWAEPYPLPGASRKENVVDQRPLILTLLLDPAAQARFDALRRAHFPVGRNHLAAHVTLFHALPAEQEPRLRADVAELARRPSYAVQVTRVRSLGRGVAYDLTSADLIAQRADLARRWAPWLTPQDARPHRAHVTVQNKVHAEQARALLGKLQSGFAPYDVTATGLALWRYLGGPWEPLDRWLFD